MNERTRETLNAINRHFYDRVAEEFDATRDHPWPGWNAVLAELPHGSLRVLDVGCGNGRFAAFLAEHRPGLLDYLGIDANAALLAHARERNRARAGAAFERCELLSAEFREEPPRGPYGLIVLFGLMHHIPSFEARRELLSALADQVAPGGLLVATQWRFGANERFGRRVIPWDAYNDGAEEPVELAQLEPGDHLLRWAEGEVPRYCHFSDDAETERLIDSLCGEGGKGGAMQLTRRFRSDGRSSDLNDYLLFRRRERSDEPS